MAGEFCTGCGTTLEVQDRFCGKCGRPRPDAGGGGGIGPNLAMPSAAPSAGAHVSEGRVVGKQVKVLPMILGVLMPLLGIGLFVAFGAGSCEEVHGSMAVGGGPHGNFTFTPTGCGSLQPYGRFGINAHADGPNDGAVYVSLDPTRGYTVEIEVPGSCRNADGTDCTVFTVPRTACETYDPHVENTNTTVNDVRLVQGHVRLRCTLEDGTTVQGSLDLDGC